MNPQFLRLILKSIISPNWGAPLQEQLVIKSAISQLDRP